MNRSEPSPDDQSSSLTDRPGRHVLTVTELTRRIQTRLEEAFPFLWVGGELSNLSRPNSGHVYFTLKDEKTQIRAFFPRSAARRVKFDLQDGMEVLCAGRITVYGRRGNYQILVEEVEPKGVGALQLAFEQLKKKLGKEGLFERRHKQPLPRFPRRIGLVTSQTGAAVQDMLRVIARRHPRMHCILCPVRVQGEQAAGEIVRAIQLFNETDLVDLLIVGRGGGSLEDLWAFNEEKVARAIFRSQIPVISAVGHEVDVTIADLVADRRALTPSEGGELAVPRIEDIEERLENLTRRLRIALEGRATKARQRLENLARSYAFRRPGEMIERYGERLKELQPRLEQALRRKLQWGEEAVGSFAGRLESLSPLSVLQRGYSITLDEEEQVIREADEVACGDRIQTWLGTGWLESEVTDVRADARFGRPDSEEETEESR